jgi:GTP-binding protein EngB required for normal cell division
MNTFFLGGKAHYLGSFGAESPVFDHVLPEIALLGHSNAGKVNNIINILQMMALPLVIL